MLLISTKFCCWLLTSMPVIIALNRKRSIADLSIVFETLKIENIL